MLAFACVTHIAAKALMTYNNSRSKATQLLLLNNSFFIRLIQQYMFKCTHLLLYDYRSGTNISYMLSYLLTALVINALVNGASRLQRAN